MTYTNNMDLSNKSDNLKNFNLEAFAGMNENDNKLNEQLKLNEQYQQNEHQEMNEHQDSYQKNLGTMNDDIYNKVKEVADIITARHIDITQDYNDWLHLGFALANDLGEQGRDLFHQLSNMNAGYTPKECDKKYDSCMKGNTGNGQSVTISTFFQMAKNMAGIDLSSIAKQRLQETKLKLNEAKLRLQEANHQQMPQTESCATCANAPSAKNSKNIAKSTVLGDFDTEMAHGALAHVAHSGYTFSDKTEEKNWPSFLSPIFAAHHDVIGRDKMLLASLNVVSGLLGGTNGNANLEQRSGIYGIYDNKRVYAPLFNIVYGSAGSAKGDMAYCKLLARPVKMEMRRQYEAAKAEYEQELAAYESQNKGKKKGERGTPPKEPAYRDPFTPGNSSSAAIYRALDANGGWGMMYETEADTVSSMIDSDYGNYSDLLRKAFHHETISMSRVSEKLHIDIENPRLSTFITCTPGQLTGLFPSFENGLGSRFLFYSLPDDMVEFHDVFASSNTTLEDIYKQMGDELLPLYHSLQGRVGHPIHFVLSDAQKKQFLSTYSEILTEQFKMLGMGITAFIFRIALSCFRYAMVLSALRKLSDWDKQDDLFSEDENALVCDDRDFQIAMSIVGCLIYHTARVYAVLAKENENPFANKNIHLSREELSLYKALPDGNFPTKCFINLAEQQNIPRRTAQRMLSNMCNIHGIIIPIKKGVYCKKQ